MLPPLVREAMIRLLADLDVELPGRAEGLYVVGSAATRAFIPARSDVDFLAVLADSLAEGGARPSAEALQGALRRRRGALARRPRPPLAHGVNGAFVRWGDLARSSLAVAPIAGQIAGKFTIGAAAEVNPVIWKLLAEHGVAVRGPHREHLDVAAVPEELHTWMRENPRTYWAGWARNVTHDPLARLLPRQATTWGVLGAPRLHYTLATGAIASKEQAGSYRHGDVRLGVARARARRARPPPRCAHAAALPARGRRVRRGGGGVGGDGYEAGSLSASQPRCT